MSIDTVNDITPRVQYVAAAAQTVFDYPFPIFQDADLVVVVDDVTKALTTHYSVTGEGDDTGGDVTFVTPMTGGEIVTIYRSIVVERDTDVQQNGPWSSSAYNDEQDKTYLILQELKDADRRNLRLPITTEVDADELELDPANWANKYMAFDSVGKPEPAVLADQTMTQSIIAGLLNPRTNREISEGVTPSAYLYLPRPKIDPRRYGVVGDGITNDTVAMQTAFNMALAQGGTVQLPHDSVILTGALNVTFLGNAITQSFVIEGSGMNGSRFLQSGSPGSILTFQSPNPAVGHTDAQIVLEGFSIQGVGKTAHGINLQSVAEFKIESVLAMFCDRAVNCSSSLVGVVRDSILRNSNYGFLSRKNGTAPSCNAITIERTQAKINSSFGIDFGGGSLLRVVGCDIEHNGAAGVVGSGGMIIRGDVEAETGFGYALVEIDGTWFESNDGRGLQTVSPQTAHLYLSLKDTKIISTDSGRAIYIPAARKVTIENSMSPSTNDTWDITCNHLTLNNTIAYTLTDTGVSTPFYINASTSSDNHLNGRHSTFTLTLTGVTTTVQAAAHAYEQGDEVTLVLAAMSGTSNSTAATITGLPTRLLPSVSRELLGVVQDNTVFKPGRITIGSGGTIALENGWTSFTAAGSKGVMQQTLTWRK